MSKGKKNHSVKKRFGDYMIDISKYILTAVLITTFFNDMSGSLFMTYTIGVVIAVSTLVVGLFYYKNGI